MSQMCLGPPGGIVFKRIQPHFAGVFGCRHCVCTLKKKTTSSKIYNAGGMAGGDSSSAPDCFLEACVAFKVGIQGILMACDYTIDWVSKSNGLGGFCQVK